MASLFKLISNDDGPGVLKTLRELSWDGVSAITVDHKGRFFYPLPAAMAAHSYKALESILSYEKTQVDANVRFSDISGESTTLHLACERGDLIAINLLLQAGADVDANLGYADFTPLRSLNNHLSILIPRHEIDQIRVWNMEFSGEADRLLYHNLQCRKALLEAGADPNQHSLELGSLLLFDCRCRRNLHAQLLIQYGAKSSRTVQEGWTEMDLALHTLNPELLRFLGSQNTVDKNEGAEALAFDFGDINERWDILERIFRKVTDRDEAYWNKVSRTLEAYLDTGVAPNAEDENGRTLLSLCCFFLEEISDIQASKLVQMLLRRGVNLNKQSLRGNGLTPLMYAAGNVGMTKALIQHGADVHAINNGDKTAIFYSLNKDVLQALVEGGADVEARNEDGLTPLLYATLNDLEEKVSGYLSIHANIHAVDNHGWSPLHYAAWNGNAYILDHLVKAGANVGARTVDRWTPLHLWGLVGRKVIMEDGNENDVVDDDAEEEEAEVAPAVFVKSRCLRGALANDDQLNNYDFPRTQSLDVLLEHGADPVAIDNEGNLAFFYLAAVQQDDPQHLSSLYKLLRLAATSGIFSSLQHPPIHG